MLLAFAAVSVLWFETELRFQHEIFLGQKRSGVITNGYFLEQDMRLDGLWCAILVVFMVPMGILVIVSARWGPRRRILAPVVGVCLICWLGEAFGTFADFTEYDPRGRFLLWALVLSTAQLISLVGAMTVLAIAMFNDNRARPRARSASGMQRSTAASEVSQ